MLRVFDSAGPGGDDSRIGVGARVAFPLMQQGRRPGGSFTELDGWPALSPVNASRPSLRAATHDSGP